MTQPQTCVTDDYYSAIVNDSTCNNKIWTLKTEKGMKKRKKED